jgi:hypothetical protein
MKKELQYRMLRLSGRFGSWSCEKAAVGDQVILVIGIRGFSTRTAAIGI